MCELLMNRHRNGSGSETYIETAQELSEDIVFHEAMLDVSEQFVMEVI